MAARASGRLFRACMAQRRCWRRRPGIARTFTKLVRRLEAHPVAVRVKPPAGGARVKVVLDGGRLVDWLYKVAFNTPQYRDVPAMIAELANGHPRRIASARAAAILATPPGVFGFGLALGVGCAEWVPYQQGSVLSIGRRAFPGYPASVLRPALHVSYLPNSCRVWKVPKAPAEQRAATPSTIPTLLLSGSFDPRHADELGTDSGADAAQLDGRGLCGDRPLRDARVALRATGVRVVPRDTERTQYGLRCGGQAAEVRQGAGGAYGWAGLTGCFGGGAEWRIASRSGWVLPRDLRDDRVYGHQ